MISPKCPSCKAANVEYVQDTTEFWAIDEIFEEGNIDLARLVESVPHDAFQLVCPSCEARYATISNFKKNKPQ